MSRTTKHSGAIKSLEFNPIKPHILATAGAKGELFIYDINHVEDGFALGNAAAGSDELECVAWNRKLPHILATGGSSGFVSVWDLKTKKASLRFNNSRKAVGAIAWDPITPTRLLTATPDDSKPVIMLWDLRNHNAPERILEGHEQGILSVSWCERDSNLLLSCGKDNRTLIWNPQTGEKLGEFPEVTNWTFQTRFNPHNPSLSATASFDGKISIQTLQNTNPSASQAPSGPVDGEDFFTKAQTQPQGASFTLTAAPKWLERPVGATFGFGGKLVSFALSPGVAGRPRSSKLQISLFSADSDVGAATEAFEKAVVAGDLSSICESHIASAKTDEEKADWKVIETLIADNPREKVTEYLGFSGVDEITNGLDKDDIDEPEEADELVSAASRKVKQNRLSSMFADSGDGDDFLSTIASSKDAKTDDPFHLLADTDSAPEKQITKALMLGQFENAMDICLKEDRFADALIIANCGGKDLLEKAQSIYLSRKTQAPNYLRLLTSVIGKNLWDVVHNADLSNWKEAMATLCTFANPTEFPDLCEALGDRLMETRSSKDASFCYLVGSKLEKVVTIWITELQQIEKSGIEDLSGDDSSFSVHARSLQDFIEKVTIFRDVTKFQDKEQNLTSDWKLAPLYAKYTEYADIVAAHGHLSIAERYLNLLPAQYPAAEVARNRVRLASRKVAQQPIQPQAQSRAQTRMQPIGYQPPAPVAPRQAVNSFAPPAPSPASNPYAPPSNQFAPTNQFAPSNQFAPQQQQSYQQPQQQQPGYGGYQQPSYGGANTGYGPPGGNFAPPPQRNLTPAAPPPKAKDVGQWNDTPMVTKVAPARRTPQPPPSTSNYPQHNMAMPPPAAPFATQRATPTPPPPPPKGPAPPRVSSPLVGGSHQFQQPPRPSSAANAYSPSAASPAPQFAQTTIPRGASPYNAPPAGPPSSNSRYAPSPVPQQQYSQPPSVGGPPQSQIAPPPQAGNRPTPPNPYAPTSNQNQYAPPPSQYTPTQPAQSLGQGPPQGPPQGFQGPASRPLTGPPPRAAAATPPATKPKHPVGDRSHIPSSAQRLVDIFTSDMQRVATKAPASYAAQVKDTQKRLNILFDHLNNEELLKPDTVQRLGELAEALQAKNYEAAAKMQVDIQREKTDECGNWMVSKASNYIVKAC